MDATMHEITYSFDGQDVPFNALLTLLRARLREPASNKGARDAVVRRSSTVIVVDSEPARAQSLGSFLQAAGYQVVLSTNMLDAFTAYLQGHYIPFALVLSGSENVDHLFLQRLVQQIQQRYDWDLLLVHFQFVQRAPISQSLTPAPGTLSPSMQRAQTRLPNSDTLPYFNPERRSSTRTTSSFYPVPAPLVPRQNSLVPLPRLAAPVPIQQDFDKQPTQPLREQEISGGFQAFSMSSETHTGDSTELVESSAEPDERAAQEIAKLKKRVTLTGQKMGRFQVGIRLGTGPSSDVYQVYDLLREQESTMKAVQIDAVPFYMMDKSMEDVTIFQREAELLSRIPHESIVPVHNCGKSYTSGSPFVYKNMPLYSEGSLRSWLRRDRRTGAFVREDVLPLLTQIVEVLQYAHDRQVLHLNLKFSNIFVTNTTKDVRALRIALSDFSYVQDGSLFPGTRDLLYAAPENWEGVVNEASDQYALAAITYELLTGRPPFQGTSERVLRILHTTKQPQLPTTLNPRLTPAINSVLIKALSKKPKDRFPSISSFLYALRR